MGRPIGDPNVFFNHDVLLNTRTIYVGDMGGAITDGAIFSNANMELVKGFYGGASK